MHTYQMTGGGYNKILLLVLLKFIEKRLLIPYFLIHTVVMDKNFSVLSTESPEEPALKTTLAIGKFILSLFLN